MFNLNQNQEENHLGNSYFDVSEQFNRKLSLARKARGEPDSGIARTVWNMGHQVRERPILWISVGIGSLFLLSAPGVLLRSALRTRRSRLEAMKGAKPSIEAA